MVEVNNFQLASGRRLEIFGKIDHPRIIDIKTNSDIVTFRMSRFFFDGKYFTVWIKFDDSRTLGIWDLFGKNETTRFKRFNF